MKFKAKISRTYVRGKQKEVRFTIGEDYIPTVKEVDRKFKYEKP